MLRSYVFVSIDNSHPFCKAVQKLGHQLMLLYKKIDCGVFVLLLIMGVMLKVFKQADGSAVSPFALRSRSEAS